MADNQLEVMFQLQTDLQRRLGHPDFTAMSGNDVAEYVRLNVLALTDELHEALAEVNWKPWAKTEPGFKDRHRFLQELSDCTHFLLNLYLVAGADATEMFQLYENKNHKNHDRQSRGYTGLDKCDQCKRELDEPDVPIYYWKINDVPFTFCSPECIAAATEEAQE